MTDNIIPQAPQTTAPMTTDEIIQRLKNILHDPRWPDLCASAEDIYEVDTALNAAIQAVERLEEIKAEAKGNCRYCKFHAAAITDFPCYGCTAANDRLGVPLAAGRGGRP